jgi:hypothetical protein
MKTLERNGLAAAAPAEAQGLIENMRADRYTQTGQIPSSRYVVHATAVPGETTGEASPVRTEARLW